MSNEAQVHALLARQLGLIAAGQAADLGMSRSMIARRVRAHEWVGSLPRVYRAAMVPSSAAQAALAAVLWAGSEALLSHESAGAAWALDGVASAKPELWVPPDRRLRSDLVVVHRGEIEAIDRRMIGPIPVTSPARTLIDLSAMLTDEDLEAAVEDALHRGLTTPDSIARRLDALGGRGRSGSGRLRDVLADRGSSAAAASRLEVKIWRTLRQAGMRPVRQHRVMVAGCTYRIDCAFPQWRLGIEGIGDRFHRSPLQRRRDQRRLADLASASWRVMPVTWHDITQVPAAVIRRVLRALSDAA